MQQTSTQALQLSATAGQMTAVAASKAQMPTMRTAKGFMRNPRFLRLSGLRLRFIDSHAAGERLERLGDSAPSADDSRLESATTCYDAKALGAIV